MHGLGDLDTCSGSCAGTALEGVEGLVVQRQL